MQYQYLVENKSTKIYFFGASHSTDKNHPQFQAIAKLFSDYKPDAVIVEGISHPSREFKEEFANYELKVNAEEIDSIISQRAEPGFTQKLAIDNAIPWFSVRLDMPQFYRELMESGYTKSDIATWIFLRSLYQYARMTNRPTFSEFANKSLANLQRDTNWQDFDYSFETINKLAEKVVAKEITQQTIPEISQHLGPYINDGNNQTAKELIIVKKIWSESAIAVDKHLLKLVADLSQKYNSILVVFGSYHAVVLEPALKSLFEI